MITEETAAAFATDWINAWNNHNLANILEHYANDIAFYSPLIALLKFNNKDGNGRAGRLLEKWFLAQLLGEKAWYLQSELNYYKNVNNYYRNLNRLGIFYEELDYTKALPFLLMLPNALVGEITDWNS